MPTITDYGVHTPTISPQAAREDSFASGDFETFLKMLTTQITHQDPLNPMDGSDFAVQLATFSGVEQQVRTNQLLEALAGQTGASGLSQLSGWIGQEVRSDGAVWFGNSPLTLDIQPEFGADQVALIVMDDANRVIGREEIGTGRGQVDWFGSDLNGQKLPDGLYRFEIESTRDGEILSTKEVEAYAKVVEARLTGDEVVLVMEGGVEVPSAKVTAIRAPRW